jgi:hypothetical protein
MKLVVFVAIPVVIASGCGRGKSQSAIDGGGGAAQAGGSGTAGAGAGSSGAGGAGQGGLGGSGGGAAGGPAGIAGAGTTGASGTTGNCPAARPEPRFSVRRVAGLQPSPGTPNTAPINEDIRHSSIVIGRDGVPVFVHLARGQILALPLTNVVPEDAGVTGNVSKVLSNPSLNRVDGVSRAAVKSDGTVVVAYLAADHAYHAEWSGRMEDAPTGSRLESPTISNCSPKIGLGIDRRDRASVVFCGSTGVNYASIENGAWSADALGFDYGFYPAVGADSSGNAVLGLYDVSTDASWLTIGTRRGGVWQFTATDPVPNTTTADFWPVVLLDSRDRLNLFFADRRTDGRLAWWIAEGSTWTKTSVDLLPNLSEPGIGELGGHHYDVALTTGGELYVARFAGGLIYEHFDGCRWITAQRVYAFPDPLSDVWWPSVAVDAAGRPHFSFQEMHMGDHSQDVLWYAEPQP